jgi:ribosomal protein S12 methylthiotransferase accessory factor
VTGSLPDTTVVGHGLIADAVAERLGVPAVAAPDGRRGGGPVVYAADGWAGPVPEGVRGRGPLLPVHTEIDRLVIGPWEAPGERGCVRCAETRSRRLGHPGEHAARERHGDRLGRAPALLTRQAARLAAALVEDDVRTAVRGSDPRTRHAVLCVDLRDLTVATHRVLPDPACESCAIPRPDVPDHTLGRPTPRPSHRPGTARGRDLPAELEGLSTRYVDARTGVLRHLHDRTEGAQIVSTAEPAGHHHGNAGFGRSPQRRISRTTAILEALERFAAVPAARRPATVGSYRDLADRALDPRTLGPHPPQEYAAPDFPYAPFDPARSYRWVWGWSFRRGAPILVPETLAYYGLDPHGDDGAGSVYEISNGCALGSSPQEAVLYGVLEVAERDAFLLTWYARLPGPEIDPATLDEADRLQAAVLRAETGYDIRLFDITAEQGIPAVWAMATAPAGSTGAAVRCAAGAHLTGARAARGALSELGAGLSFAIEHFQDPEAAAAAARMVDDPAEVRHMEDHPLLYCEPRAAERLRFLTGLTPTRPIGEVGVRTREFADDDIDAVMRAVVGRYLRDGLDVVVVDQTPDELREADLHCVKVLVPGTLSMTFGHRYRRTTGLPRLLEARRRRGLSDRRMREDEINPHPHPFP